MGIIKSAFAATINIAKAATTAAVKTAAMEFSTRTQNYGFTLDEFTRLMVAVDTAVGEDPKKAFAVAGAGFESLWCLVRQEDLEEARELAKLTGARWASIARIDLDDGFFAGYKAGKEVGLEVRKAFLGIIKDAGVGKGRLQLAALPRLIDGFEHVLEAQARWVDRVGEISTNNSVMH